jgi:Fic family protein
MESLKIKTSDSTRLRIGTYIKQNPELHEVIRQWGWVTLVLNANEKLIARMLINAERDSKPTPSIVDISKAVLVSEEQVNRGLTMLERYEIVKREKGAPSPGYKVAQRYLKWEPRLDFIFHTVTLADGRKFSVN